MSNQSNDYSRHFFWAWWKRRHNSLLLNSFNGFCLVRVEPISTKVISLIKNGF